MLRKKHRIIQKQVYKQIPSIFKFSYDDEGKKNSSKAAPGAEIHEIATCSAV